MILFSKKAVEVSSHPRFDTKEYVRTRRGYFAECAFSYLITLTTTDTFLAKLLLNIGMDDATIGVVSSVISFAYLFSIFQLLIVPHVKSMKKIVTFGYAFGNFLLASLFLIPFLPVSKTVKIVLAIVASCGGYFSKHITTEIYTKWVYYFVDPKHRAEFSSKNSMVSLIASAAYILLSGYIVDHFEEKQHIEIAFIIMAALTLAMMIGSAVSLLSMKDGPQLVKEEESSSLGDVFAYVKKNKSYQRVLLLFVLTGIPSGLLVGFLGTYKTQDLGMSVTSVQIIFTIFSLMWAAISVPCGRYEDRTYPLHCYRLGVLFTMLSYATVIFTVPDTWWLVILYYFFWNLGQAGYAGSTITVFLEYLSDKFLVQCLAIRFCVTGLAGFLSSLLGARILDYVQANGFSVFGVELRGQQVQAIIATFIMGLVILYSYRVQKKKSLEEIEA